MNEPEASQVSQPGDLPPTNPVGNPDELPHQPGGTEQTLPQLADGFGPTLGQKTEGMDTFKAQEAGHQSVHHSPNRVLETGTDHWPLPNGSNSGEIPYPAPLPDGNLEVFVPAHGEPNFATTRLSGQRKTPAGSIQVLVIFLLASFSLCSAMLNLYLFWQARNLGAELERLKPPGKSGLAPRK